MAARGFLYGGGSGGEAAAGGIGVGGGSVLLTNKRVHCSSSLKPVDPFFAPRSSRFQGSRSMLSFDDGGSGSGGRYFQSFDHEDNGDDEYDEYFHHQEKKRRLTADQVRFLEKSFEADNKLEPDRKIQIAKDLGLQPRQVAIWFQNRRARWKNKQLEKDYDDLQESYKKLKANYENLVKEKEKLKSKVDELSDKLMIQEKGASDSSSTKSPCEAQVCERILEDVSKTMETGYGQDSNFTGKNVDFGNEVHAPVLEQADSSYVFEQEQSEVKSYYLGLPGDDQAFGFWSY